MEQQGQLHNNYLFLLSVFCFLAACGKEKSTEILEIDTKGLEKKKGTYYYNGESYSGAVFRLFETGDTAEYSELKNGRKEGVSKKWWAGGELKFLGNYKEGVYHGEVLEWYKDGQQYAHFNYDMGKEQGRQQIWKTDGGIKANYEVIGDRKYGLTGVKNCSNVWE